MITILIDGKKIETTPGSTILDAALDAGLYIPHLCSHQSVGPLADVMLDEVVYQGTEEFRGEHAGQTVKEADQKGCGLCKVFLKWKEQPVPACRIVVEEGMEVTTTDDELIRLRQASLSRILADHPHACLLCEQREGCSRTQCSMNVEEKDRCCILLGRCEIGKVSDYVGYAPDLPTYRAPEKKNILKDPLFIRDYSLCIGCLKCVRVCRDIVKADVLGAVVQHGSFIVGTKLPGDMPDAECRFCGACVEICPTGALRDREGVETPAKGAPVPCIHSCPGEIDIPDYVRAIAEEDLDSARKIIAKSVPLPATLGYVCFHPCEEHCRRAALDASVAICDLKRFAFEGYEGDPAYLRGPETGKSVAIIGAGPAGLSASWLLAMKGHKVTMFDEASEPGGFLRHAIPRFRLPLKALEQDLKFIKKLGVEFHGNRKLGKDLDPRRLREFGFDAVLLAMGTPLSKQIDVEGTDLEGVLWGIDFLRDAASGLAARFNEPVIVVGGGSVAMDTAMTARRLGATSVEIICLEQSYELPAHAEEVEEALEEEIHITYGWGPVSFTSGDDNHIAHAKFLRCNKVYDDTGRFAPQFAQDAFLERDIRWVILAIGQETDQSAFGPETGEIFKNRNLMSKDSESMETWLPGFFGAGDLVHGPSSVIEAIASGKRAAKAIDQFLGGDGDFEIEEEPQVFDGASITLDKRQPAEKKDPESRTENFDLIRLTLDPVQATAEANRCLRCNIRRLIKPAILPPEEWHYLNKSLVDSSVEEAGVCILASSSGDVKTIKGGMSIRTILREWLENQSEEAGLKVKWFVDPMYTKRESELIQQHIQEHGQMPEGDDELDDLF